MTEKGPDKPWHERNPLMDPEAATMYTTGVYTGDGEPRDRGIFTHVDREYIIGQRTSDSPQQRSNVRGRQVQRVSDAIKDFQLLLRLGDRTKDRIFEDAAEPYVHQDLRDVIRFFYEGMDHDKDLVEGAVMSAVWEAESAVDGGEIKSVDTEITIDRGPDPDTALEMFESGEYDRLTLEQIGVLAREGLLDEADWQKLEGPAPGDSPFERLDEGSDEEEP